MCKFTIPVVWHRKIRKPRKIKRKTMVLKDLDFFWKNKSFIEGNFKITYYIVFK